MLQYHKEKLEKDIEGIKGEAAEFKETYFNEDTEWHEGLGKKAWYPIKKIGDSADYVNDQVSLRNALQIEKGRDLLPGQTWDDAILDYSVKDLRDDTAGGIGNVAGFVTKQIPGVSDERAEQVNDAFELGGQILLPGIEDVATGGVGYLDNLARGAKQLKKFDANAASKMVDQVFNARRFGGELTKLKNSAVQKVEEVTDAITGPFRTAKALIGGDSIVANIGTGLDSDIAKASSTLDPRGLRDWGRKKRIAGAKFITGNNIQKEDIFVEAGWKVLDQLNKRFGININRAISPFQVHHKGVIRQVAESANGLTDEAAKLAGDYISKRVGFKLGYDPSNASPLPAQFHQRVHDISTQTLLINSGTLLLLEQI